MDDISVTPNLKNGDTNESKSKDARKDDGNRRRKRLADLSQSFDDLDFPVAPKPKELLDFPISFKYDIHLVFLSSRPFA